MKTSLESLSCRELITFHDGFSYFADAFDLTILRAMEEEAGSEASAVRWRTSWRRSAFTSFPPSLPRSTGPMPPRR